SFELMVYLYLYLYLYEVLIEGFLLLYYNVLLFIPIVLLPSTSTLFPYTTLFRSGPGLLDRARPAADGPSADRPRLLPPPRDRPGDRKSTRLNSSHVKISYAVFCLKKKNISMRMVRNKIRRSTLSLSIVYPYILSM